MNPEIKIIPLIFHIYIYIYIQDREIQTRSTRQKQKPNLEPAGSVRAGPCVL